MQNFAFRDPIGGIRKDPHDPHASCIDHHLERPRVQEVTHEDAGSVAETGVGGRSPPPQVGLVHDVVVQQGCRVNELDDRSQQHVGRAAVPEGAGNEQHNGRPEPLPACTDDVVGNRIDQDDVRTETLPDDCVDSLHIGSDRRKQGFQVRGRRTVCRRLHG